MKLRLTLFSLALFAAASGCASQQYAGTWVTTPGDAAGDFEFGGMTLSEDGTYTAFAEFEGLTRAFSGTWDLTQDGDGAALLFEHPRPAEPRLRYYVETDESGPDMLVVTDPQTGYTARMRRLVNER